jgi:ATP-dependent helicase HrpB
VDIEETGKPEALVRQASAIRRDWLPRERISAAVEVDFDPVRERVLAFRRTRYDDLILDEAATDLPPSYDVGTVLSRELARRPDRLALFSRPEAAPFIARVRCLRDWMPELKLPAFDDGELIALLPQLCAGCRSFDDLRRVPVVAFLRGMLTAAQLRALDREAPERIAIPSGSRVLLQYEVGRPPVLAVRIQELSGLRETPRVAGGRVPVLLHLLAPNMRPQQVTDDLKSFWTATYPVIRKELRRRYPKHAWPEDPHSAAPERSPSKRRPRTR